MTALRYCAILGLAFCSRLVTGGEPNSPAVVRAVENPSADRQDLLLLGATQPIVLRLHVRIDGVPFRTAQKQIVEATFDQFDADIDGILSESQGIALLAMLADGSNEGVKSAKMPARMAVNAARNLTKRAFVELFANRIAPFEIRQRLASRGAGPALFPLLDRNRDGRLSADELAHAEQSLECRDFNDDGLITLQELILGPQNASGQKADDASDGMVIAMNAGDGGRLADLLLNRYDQNRDGRLSCELNASEVHLPRDQLKTLDVDGDQILSRQELLARAALPPDIELDFALGRSNGSIASKQSTNPAASDGEFRLRRKLDGGYKLYIGEMEVDLRRNNRDPSQADDPPRLEQYDADANAYLDEAELKNAGLPVIGALDSDGNQQVSKRELEQYFDRKASLARARLVLEASDQGHDLFTRLDQNFDRVLTPRELHGAADVLKTEDQDGDGFLNSGEIPQQLSLEIFRGSARSGSQLRGTVRTPSAPKVKAELKGPVWFRKMDRNDDGDVALLEFLGDRSVFERLDRDADGLVDADEAAVADKPPDEKP